MLTKKELGKAIEAARIKKGVSKAALARRFGVTPPSVQGWVQEGRIDKKRLTDLIEYFSDTVGPEHWGLSPSAAVLRAPQKQRDDLLTIPRLDVAGSMGHGRMMPVDHVDVIEQMSISREYLRRTITPTNPANLALITGYGDSMEGTFSDGDLLLVDRGVTDIQIDAVYVLALGDDLYIKRIQRRPDGSLLMLSDNPKYAPYEIKNGEAERFQVLGRVLLAWNARRL